MHISIFYIYRLSPYPNALSATLYWGAYLELATYGSISTYKVIQDKWFSSPLSATDRNYTDITRYLANNIESLIIYIERFKIIRDTNKLERASDAASPTDPLIIVFAKLLLTSLVARCLYTHQVTTLFAPEIWPHCCL